MHGRKTKANKQRRLQRRRWANAVLASVFGFGVVSNFAFASEPSANPAVESAAPPIADPAPTTASDLSLDALLDLADKAPEKLQSIGVTDSSRGVVGNQELIFDPDKSSSATANSTGGLLSQAPGVVIRSTSALNQDVRIRGYSGSQLVGIAEGMNQGKTRLDIDSLFSQIDPNLVDSITVISGPYSVIHGPGFAFFDAQLIAPKRTDELTFFSDSYFGLNSNGQQIALRETAGYSQANSGVIVSYGQRWGNSYKPGSNSTDFRVPADYNSEDIYVALSHDLTDSSRLDVRFIHQELKNTLLPGVAYDINHQHADQINVRWTMQDEFQKDRLLAQMWWNQAAYNGDSSRASKQQTFVSRLLAEPYTDLAGGGTLIGRGLSDNWGARLLSNWGDLDTWHLMAGVDWRRTRQFYRERDFDANGVPALFGDTFGIPDSSSDDFGVFLGGTLALTEIWTVGVGQRVDAVTYGINAQDEVITTTQFTPNGEYVSGTSTDTRVLSSTYVTSSLQVSEVVSFSAGAAYAMRPPNLTELYSDQPFAPLVRFGNSFAFGDSRLDSEQNLQFDLGFTAKREQTTFGTRVFHSTIHDYIGLAPTNYGTFPLNGVATPGTLDRGRPYMLDPNVPNTDMAADSASVGYIYRNLERVTLYGFDVTGEHQILPGLEILGSLTYTRGTNHNPGFYDVYTGTFTTTPGSEGLPGIYPLNGSMSVRLVEPEDRRWSLEWQSRFVSLQDYLAYSLGEVGTPGFAVHNIHASYRWSERLTLRTSLLNVFDRNYYEHNSLAIVDRNGNIGFVKNPGLAWFMSVDLRF